MRRWRAPLISGKPEARISLGIIDHEHRGDAIVDDIHELLDNAFIMRFDIADCMRLTDDLDNVIDGMRKVAIHIDIYKPVIGELPPDAMQLFAIGERMMHGVRELVTMLVRAQTVPGARARNCARHRRGGIRSRYAGGGCGAQAGRPISARRAPIGSSSSPGTSSISFSSR